VGGRSRRIQAGRPDKAILPRHRRLQREIRKPHRDKGVDLELQRSDPRPNLRNNPIEEIASRG